MRTAFDHTATGYDAAFTNTAIGKLQRQSVWSYLLKTFNEKFPSHILELNCGTGEDAVFFAKQGSHVVATDISQKMIEVANIKISSNDLNDHITTKQLDIYNIDTESFAQKFDLVFSNFGGLNCVDPKILRSVFHNLSHLLNPGGRVILVIMPRFCAWESVYFLSKLQWKEAFRRRKDAKQTASLGESNIDIWYYDPAQVEQLAGEHFKIIHTQPVGIAVPPSYFKRTFISNQKILKNLNAAEKKLNKFKSLSRIADHYLIDLELK